MQAFNPPPAPNAAAALQGPLHSAAPSAQRGADLSALPHSHEDVAALNDLSQLDKDPAAGMAPLPADDVSAAASPSDAGAEASSGLSALPPAPAPAASPRATDAADRGLFDLWENAGKGGGSHAARQGRDSSSSLGEADSQDGVTLASAPAAPAQPADYYGIPNGGAAVPV